MRNKHVLAPDKATPETSSLGDMVILRRDLTPTYAHLLADFLRHCGIQAEAGDTTLVQLLSPITLALGAPKSACCNRRCSRLRSCLPLLIGANSPCRRMKQRMKTAAIPQQLPD